MDKVVHEWEHMHIKYRIVDVGDYIIIQLGGTGQAWTTVEGGRFLIPTAAAMMPEITRLAERNKKLEAVAESSEAYFRDLWARHPEIIESGPKYTCPYMQDLHDKMIKAGCFKDLT